MDEISSPEAKRARKQRGSMLSKLPAEIWGEIGKRLRSRLDVLRFRSVCRRWRWSLPPPSLFPLRVPLPPGPSKPRLRQFPHFIVELTYYAVNQMVVVFEEVLKGGTFSSSAIVPEAQSEEAQQLLRPPSKSTDLSSSLSFLSNAYHLHCAIPTRRHEDKSIFFGNKDALKIVIISGDANRVNVNPNYTRVSDLTVVAHLVESRKLAVLRLADADPDWDTGFCNTTFEDIVNYRGHLYAVDKLGAAFVMDYTSLKMTKVGDPLPDYNPPEFEDWRRHGKKLHLAVWSDDLYLLIHIHHPQIIIPSKIYKLSSHQWLQVELPADTVFFMDVHCNFPVATNLLTRDDGVMKYQIPRFFAWPHTFFIPLDEDPDKLNHIKPIFGLRHCDLPYLAWLPVNSACL